jgi:hypothetical protein
MAKMICVRMMHLLKIIVIGPGSDEALSIRREIDRLQPGVAA